MAYSAEASSLIELLADRPVAYHPAMARALGGIKEAIFVCQLLYWHGKGKRRDGYIWKTQADFEDETALSRYEQETARRKLVALGVLYEKRAGVPARLHYRLDMDKLGEILQSSLQRTPKLDCGKPPNKVAENSQTIPETTQESTTENSTETQTPQDGDSFTDLFPEQETTAPTEPAGDHSVRDHKDPVSMIAHCVEKREQSSGGAPDWAMVGAEGVHPLYYMVVGFCAMTQQEPSLFTPKMGKRWLAWYERLSDEHGFSPRDLLQAHEFLPDKDRGAWYVENHKWSTPYNDSYEEQLVLAAMQVKSGTITVKGAWSKVMS